ncbi:MAG: L,D-transpeptidase family protein [Terriglobales bacterium]
MMRRAGKLVVVAVMSAVLALALSAGGGWAAAAEGSRSTPAVRIEKVVVYKQERRMDLFHQGKVWKGYRIALGGNPVGHKLQRGDGRTPEGAYVLDWRNPHSQSHRSIHISYPNARDRASARRRGVSPGGDIFIHGLRKGMGSIGAARTARDWTDGCIAVTNEEIEEIWKAVPNGTPIQINP